MVVSRNPCFSGLSLAIIFRKICYQGGNDVAILILVDFPLQFENAVEIWTAMGVAILILVDFPLQYMNNFGEETFKPCRNPYFSGLSLAMQVSKRHYDEVVGRNPYFSGLSLAIAPKISSKIQNSNANSWKSCEFCANIKI